MESFHFHYSGHGVFNASIELDPNCYSKTVDETIYMSSETVGDCMVGIKGKLYSVMELKQDLLKLKSERWTVTLDMCRDRRGGMGHKVHVEHLSAIPHEYLSRLAVLYGTSELHQARDSHSFTCQLCQLVKSRRTPLCIVDIPGKVNEIWEKKKIKQRCKLDCVEVGDNWKSFYWPTKPSHSRKIKRISSMFEDPETKENEEVTTKPPIMNPLVIALGEKNKRSDEELSFRSGDVFESLPELNTQQVSSGGWVQGSGWVQGIKDGQVGWYPKEYTTKMVKYRINQFGIEKQKNNLEEKRQLESQLSGYKVRAIVSREAMKDDEIPLKLNDIITKLEHEVEPGWSRGEKDDIIGVFPTGAVVRLLRSQNIQTENKYKDNLKINDAKDKLKIPTETKPRVKFGNIHLTVRKQGTLKRKDTSDKLFLRNNWQSTHFILAANYLMGFKSQKSFIQMSAEEKIQPCLILDLNGSRVQLKENDGFTVETIFGAVWSFKGSSFYDAKPWFDEISCVIQDFITINHI
eukprot:GFUD01016095.1.p1 GENE.GFUD01016095.1~~GFUD01016095.1.p1  ORF type:complete len:561 (-),score=139.18 GFUD01016095.1:3-1559(-)